LASTSGAGTKFTLKLKKGQKINQIVLAEDITSGERVRAFVLEGKTNAGWKTIFEGSCIGHKFIHRFDDIEVASVRLKIQDSVGEPNISNFIVYDSKE